MVQHRDACGDDVAVFFDAGLCGAGDIVLSCELGGRERVGCQQERRAVGDCMGELISLLAFTFKALKFLKAYHSRPPLFLSIVS